VSSTLVFTSARVTVWWGAWGPDWGTPTASAANAITMCHYE
jgi:hypothetical protein